MPRARRSVWQADQTDFLRCGVQLGISRQHIDAHLADLMAFGINYVREVGASKPYWLVSASAQIEMEKSKREYPSSS